MYWKRDRILSKILLSLKLKLFGAYSKIELLHDCGVCSGGVAVCFQGSLIVLSGNPG
jgi:hypothetical protein